MATKGKQGQPPAKHVDGMREQGYVLTSEAAEEAGVGQHLVQRAAKAGKVQSVPWSRWTFVNLDQVKQMFALPEIPDAPKKGRKS